MICLTKKNVIISGFLIFCFLLMPDQILTAESVNNNFYDDAVNGYYQIGIGDVLQIITWKEEDFSRDDVLVRLDGKITFPLLDDIKAAGLSPFQLKQNIETLLKHYIELPNVTVIVREPVSQKFYILGEVQRVGEYPLVKKLTIVQAFAMAGGFTEWATKKEILLFRKIPGQPAKVIKVDYKKIIRGKGLEQNFLIRADDTIIVP